MKASSPLLLAVAIGLLPGLSCGTLEKPEIQGIENVKLTRVGLRESSMTLDLYGHNPNKANLKLKEAEGQAWLDSNYLGRFTIDSLIRIPGKKDFRLPVKLEVDMAKFLQNSALLAGKKEVLVTVHGRARVGKGLLFINYPLNYVGKQNLSKLMK